MPEAEDRGICFVISPIGSRDTAIRKRADQVLKYVIEPAASECGYTALRADRISEPGMITRQVITQVIDAPMVVADLTDHNANVFYELAIRHAIGKPVVKIIQAGQLPPFDVGQSRTIPLDHNDLESADACRQELVRQIQAAVAGDHDADNPITEAITLNAMRQSGDPEQQQLAAVLGGIQDLSTRMRRLESAVSRREHGQLGGRRQVPVSDAGSGSHSAFLADLQHLGIDDHVITRISEMLEAGFSPDEVLLHLPTLERTTLAARSSHGTDGAAGRKKGGSDTSSKDL